MSARSVSDCDETDTYSPAAIDIAPAASPATPAIAMARGSGSAAATPTMIAETETMPSLAPSTAARSQFARVMKCGSSMWAEG